MARRKTQEEFLEQAKAIHGDKYDYSEVVYKQAHSPVKIICKIHGPFLQNPTRHTRGAGCLVCANIRTISHTTKNLDYFLPKLIEIHKDKYDFSQFVYKNYKAKGTVICDCGQSFQMTMNHLLRGQGCTNCAISGYRPNVPCSVYVIAVGNNYLKCGISTDIRSRFNKIKRKCTLDNFRPLYCADFETSYLAKELEDLLKSNFEHSLISKEVMPDGFTETYRIEDVGEIMRVISHFSSEHAVAFKSLDNFTNDLSG